MGVGSIAPRPSVECWFVVRCKVMVGCLSTFSCVCVVQQLHMGCQQCAHVRCRARVSWEVPLRFVADVAVSSWPTVSIGCRCHTRTCVRFTMTFFLLNDQATSLMTLSHPVVCEYSLHGRTTCNEGGLRHMVPSAAPATWVHPIRCHVPST